MLPEHTLLLFSIVGRHISGKGGERHFGVHYNGTVAGQVHHDIGYEPPALPIFRSGLNHIVASLCQS